MMFESSRWFAHRENIGVEPSRRFAENKKPGYRQARLEKPNPRTTENKKSGMYQPSRRALAPGSLIEKNIGIEPSRRALAPGSR